MRVKTESCLEIGRVINRWNKSILASKASQRDNLYPQINFETNKNLGAMYGFQNTAK